MDKSFLVDERSRKILRCLVQNYIRTGVPVGSSSLSKRYSINLSSASIRNVMASLEEHGFLESPHRSAGRVPTALGYRLFIDQLLQLKPLKKSELASLKSKIIACIKGGQTLERVGGLLSDLTHMAGIITICDKNQMKYLKRIELIRIEHRKILAVLLLANGEVENRIFEVSRRYTDSELKSYANYLADQFSGHNLQSIRLELLEKLENIRQDMSKMMFEAMALASRVFDTKADGDYIISGQNNLMNFEELSNTEKLHELFAAFNRKKELLEIFDSCIAANKIKIFIGQESGLNMLRDCSIICAPYYVNHDVVGVFAVIGPTRIKYERVIPLVGGAADLFGETLN